MLSKVDSRLVLAAAIVGLILLALLLLAFRPLPMGNDQAFYMLLGALGRELAAVYSFFFSSTKSSGAKDETIARLTASAAK